PFADLPSTCKSQCPQTRWSAIYRLLPKELNDLSSVWTQSVFFSIQRSTLYLSFYKVQFTTFFKMKSVPKRLTASRVLVFFLIVHHSESFSSMQHKVICRLSLTIAYGRSIFFFLSDHRPVQFARPPHDC